MKPWAFSVMPSVASVASWSTGLLGKPALGGELDPHAASTSGSAARMESARDRLRCVNARKGCRGADMTLVAYGVTCIWRKRASLVAEGVPACLWRGMPAGGQE